MDAQGPVAKPDFWYYYLGPSPQMYRQKKKIINVNVTYYESASASKKTPPPPRRLRNSFSHGSSGPPVRTHLHTANQSYMI